MGGGLEIVPGRRQRKQLAPMAWGQKTRRGKSGRRLCGPDFFRPRICN